MGTRRITTTLGNSRIPEKCLPLVNRIQDLEVDEDVSSQLIEELVTVFRDIGTTALLKEETHDGGLFSGRGSNFEKRFQPDISKVQTICLAMRLTGHSIVLTSGTFDIIHIGHAGYLEAASNFGDFLVVGVDSDEKVRASKGPGRPIVPQEERLRMLAHLRGVSLLTLKEQSHPKWHLIKTLQPDTLIATEGTYDDEDYVELGEYCGRVVVLPPQSTTSTTARLRTVQVTHGLSIQEQILSELETLALDDTAKNILRSLVSNTLSSTDK